LVGEPLVLFERVVADDYVLAGLAVVTLVLLLLTDATANILSSLIIGLVLVVLHAALHKAEARCTRQRTTPTTRSAAGMPRCPSNRRNRSGVASPHPPILHFFFLCSSADCYITVAAGV
jgi:hypothetical protein